MKRLRPIAVLLALALAPAAAAAQRAAKPAEFDRAAALVREGRVAEAERELNAMLARRPDNAGALNLLGALRAQQGRLDEAETLFARAVRSDPAFAGPHMNLAYLYVLKGEPEKTISELKEVLRLEPDNADAAEKLARLLFSQHHVDEGIAFVEAEKTRHPLTPLYALLGDAYASKGDWGNAETNYRLALDRDAGNVTALLGMAQVSTRSDDPEAVAQYLGRARDIVSGSPALLYRFALVAVEAGFYDDAGPALVEVVKQRPEDASAHMLLGIAWVKTRDLADAEGAFRRVLALEPQNGEARLYLGYVLLKLKKFPEAQDLLEKCAAANADAPEALYYLGLLALGQKDEKRAAELLGRVVERFPNYSYAHIALGIAFLGMKDFPRARHELELGVKMNPGDQKGHYNLALLYSRTEEPDRARDEMKVVADLKAKADAKAGEDDEEISAPEPGSN